MVKLACLKNDNKQVAPTELYFYNYILFSLFVVIPNLKTFNLKTICIYLFVIKLPFFLSCWYNYFYCECIVTVTDFWAFMTIYKTHLQI